jgi:DNA-binding LacI/PurR family transcriptional regulator
VEIMERLAAKRTGVVIVPSWRVSHDCAEVVSRLLNVDGLSPRWPIVHLPFGQADFPFDAVRMDDERGIYAAVTHLWNLGHRELAFAMPGLEWSNQYPWLFQRMRAFERAVQLVSRGTSVARVISSPSEELNDENQWSYSARSVAVQLLENPEYAAVTGVIASNDAMAEDLIGVLRQHGRGVPQDFSIVGFDDNAWSSSAGLTTLHVPVEEMGEQAAQLILRRFAEPETNQRAGNHRATSITIGVTIRDFTRTRYVHIEFFIRRAVPFPAGLHPH